eukprot:CAMPEP_0197035220 /NCGR_PEP_ID=MMETSP1384-20130603/13076_1 /TAXON_ID=29189 /ORGANISM="Ammonia sp." /LENGTH=178 /DNA_ID=CAMNT_0042465251 /DNA_START=83 /DNA_END=619 /DNA_ORIENTATION=-
MSEKLHIFPDITPRTKEKLMEEERMKKLHHQPPLPDDVDEYGNLPQLRCGWRKCGQVFKTRDELMAHVRKCLPHPFVGRFHLNCKNVLENDPDLTLQEFMNRVVDCYDEADQRNIEREELVTYYKQFQPLFKAHYVHEKDTAKMSATKKELVEILFNFRIESQKNLASHNTVPDQFAV